VTLDRRAVLGLGAAAAIVPATARAARWPAAERLPLWPGLPSGDPPSPPLRSLRGPAVPELGVYRPMRPDGRSVLVIPGGGYGFVSLENEGADVAELLVRVGITAFVLNYRLPIDGWRDRADVPLQDAQRALRLIREFAARYRIDRARTAVLGFSAGGHLAGSLATMAQVESYRPLDAADRQSARPAAAGLIYAVSNMSAGRSFGGSRANLLGRAPAPAVVRRFAVDEHLAGAPPLFLAAAEDDPTVPIINTLDLAAAARRARVPREIHLFARGGHGFGAHPPARSPAALWPELFDRWLAEALSRTV
jgi:acetyl esterase/lipase